MARFSVSGKINASGSVDTYHITDAVNASTTAADQATVAADIATLVADGAAPTQAHVNTLNTDWTAFIADIAAVPANADVVLSFNASTVKTRGALRAALEALIQCIAGSNALTP